MGLVYGDDMLIFSRSMQKIERLIHSSLDDEYEYTDEGDIKSYLGIDVSEPTPGTYKLSQPHLIDQIQKDLCLSTILSRHSDSEAFDNLFHYKSVIGKLNYLEKSTRSGISYITHQCA